HGGIHDADVQVADQLTTQLADIGAELVDGFLKPQRSGIDPPSGFREPEADPATVAQAHAEPQLERRHLSAYGGRADIQLRLRADEAAAFNDLPEYAQQLNVGRIELLLPGKRHDISSVISEAIFIS